MNLNTVLVQAITKGALSANRKPLAALRRDVALLKREVTELRRLVRGLTKQVGSVSAAGPEAEAETKGGEGPRIRPTGAMVRKVRAKLGLTQAELAELIGAASLTISKWERTEGRIAMRSRTMAAFAAARGMGKLAAQQKLEGAQAAGAEAAAE